MADLKWELWPVDDVRITGRFGQDYGGYLHRGLDLGCADVDNPPLIYAPADGKAVGFVNDGGFGVGVCLDHEDTPWYSLYAHMSESYVTIGQDVKAGTVIGKMGWTGKVDPPNKWGTHLHWQVCKSASFPTDISLSADPLSFPFTITTPEAPAAPAVDEATIRRIVEEVLNSRKMSPAFAEAVTWRIDQIHKATKSGAEWEQLRAINWATDLRNTGYQS